MSDPRFAPFTIETTPERPTGDPTQVTVDEPVDEPVDEAPVSQPISRQLLALCLLLGGSAVIIVGAALIDYRLGVIAAGFLAFFLGILLGYEET